MASNNVVCTQCSYDQVDVQRTGSMMVTYCQQCGHTTEEKRDPPREKWDDITRAKLKPSDHGKRTINHLIPLPDKKRKRG